MSIPETSMLHNDPLLQRIWNLLGRPARCFAVGGYVRDRLLGRPSRDLDLTVEGTNDDAATPAQKLASAFGARAHLLGTPPHRIWRVETPSLKVELWPRGDLSHEDDLQRRDFSCNALSWELPKGPLIDCSGGLDDLQGRRLRAISRANLEDDPVRLLRAARFLAQLPDFELDQATRNWIRELAPSLSGAPRERIGQELLTLLRAPMASRGLGLCLDLGLFDPMSPEPHTNQAGWLAAHMGAVETLNRRSDHGSGATDAARLAFLIRSWGIPTDGKLARYAWPRPERERASRAARMLDQARSVVDNPPADRRELAWRAGAAFPALIALAAALEPNRSGWRRWRRQWQRNPTALENPRPLLTGEVIATITGLEPGPELGRIATALLRAQVRGELRSQGGARRWLRSTSRPATQS